ncbi:MAG: tetratricopeptide repeat protein [Chlorobia bacterium]|nr:tetratricopeptide repeat protein [Fimbriimonadaceae bacterium]
MDSAFCKKCGATLDANDIALAGDKLAATIADGNRLFADGRTDDALMVAETAISTNPSSAAAISLKGMCLERKGLLAEALECFEQVVALQPDSTLDKLKVNDLKNMLVVEKFEVNRTPDRRVAAVGAIAATVLVVACGALFAKVNASSKPTDDKSKLVAMNGPTEGVRRFDEVLPKDTQAPTVQPNNQPLVDPNAGANQGSGLDGRTQAGTNRSRENLNIEPYNGRTIPKPNGGDEGSFGPIVINPDDVPKPTKPGPTGTKGIDEEPEELKLPTNPPVEDPKPKNDPGIIEIEVSKGSPNRGNGGGAEAPISGNGRQALLATARSQMQSGNYSAAANTYERALRAGADSGSTNQRLGQCYTNMGRNGDAIAAYTRAASSFEKSGNSQGVDACRQAIKVLGG